MAVIFKEDGHIYESLNENLEKDKIKSLSSLAKEIGLEVLIEVHDENELKKCLIGLGNY